MSRDKENAQVDEIKVGIFQDPVKKKTSFEDVKKTKIQLTWKNVSISAYPVKKMCGRKSENQENIAILSEFDIQFFNEFVTHILTLSLGDLNGTVKPGQFLSIIGASGKDSIRINPIADIVFRCRKDHSAQLSV